MAEETARRARACGTRGDEGKEELRGVTRATRGDEEGKGELRGVSRRGKGSYEG
jgi:hypothetical protein